MPWGPCCDCRLLSTLEARADCSDPSLPTLDDTRESDRIIRTGVDDSEPANEMVRPASETPDTDAVGEGPENDTAGDLPENGDSPAKDTFGDFPGLELESDGDTDGLVTEDSNPSTSRDAEDRRCRTSRCNMSPPID